MDCHSIQWLPGVISGVVSSLIAMLIVHCCEARRDRNKYGVADGDYIGYGFEDDMANPLVQKKELQSRAKVHYLKKNILQIEVEHDGRKWNGDIAMEAETFGTVVWRYVDYSKDKDMFGFKRILIRDEAGEVRLYIVEEKYVGNDRHFGKEVFIRRK